MNYSTQNLLLKRIVLSVSLFFTIFLGISTISFAEWPEGGVQLSGTVSDWGLQWDVISDGEGGAWIVWTE